MTVPTEPLTEQVPNPEYASWAGAAVGTVVVRRITTAGKDQPEVTTTTTTTTLVGRTSAVVNLDRQETTRRYDGEMFVNPAEQVTVPATIPLASGVTRADFGRPGGNETTEVLTVDRARCETRCFTCKDRSEGGEVFTRTWYSDQIPGRLVKAVVTTPGVGKTVTTELLEVRRPATP